MKNATMEDRIGWLEEDVGRLADSLYELRQWRDEPLERVSACPILRLLRPAIDLAGVVGLLWWASRDFR